MFLTISFLLLIFVSGAYLLVWPNTFVSQVNVSFWPKPLVRSMLINTKSEKIRIKLKNEEKQVSRLSLGIELDVNQTMNKLNPSDINDLVDKWRKSLSQITFVQPVFGISEDLHTLVSEKISKKIISEENFKYNPETGLFLYETKENGSNVNVDDLVEKLTLIKEERDLIEIEEIVAESEMKKKVEELNAKMNKMLENPLEIKLKNIQQDIVFEKKDLLGFITASPTDNLERVQIKTNKIFLKTIITNKTNENISMNWLAKMIEDELIKRSEGETAKVLVLGIDTGPNSDGSVAQKYLEVDISQQKLYFFENGEVLKTYPVSTGQYYPTPTGSYKIMNKSELGYSGIFKVWMPYWMAFDYRKDLGAYLGIHELPYMLKEGEKFYRFGNYIGTKKTGGCIALSPGDSKEVYDKTKTGTDLIIFE